MGRKDGKAIMFSKVARKFALTAYGHVGTDGIRVTLAELENGVVTFVRADGTNTPLPFLPTEFRTSGDVVNVAATMVETYNMSAFDWASLPAHGWKTTLTLAEAATKFGIADSVIARLMATYNVDVAIAA